MSTHDSDGIDEALLGVTHVAMTAAARIGEQLARMREQQACDAQAHSEQAAREQAARMTAEREAARASLASVHRPEWWDNAQAEDITKAYTTARAWSEVDPEAVRAEQRIVEEVRNRFGVDARAGEPASVAEAIERAEIARDRAAEERTGASGDRAEAVGLMAAADATDRSVEDVEERLTRLISGADRADFDAERLDDADNPVSAAQLRQQAQEWREEADALAQESGLSSIFDPEAEAGQAYDSAERREAMAQGFDHIENRAAVDARVRSDVAQGRPVTDAVANAPGHAPKARKTKGTPQPARKVQRAGQTR